MNTNPEPTHTPETTKSTHPHTGPRTESGKAKSSLKALSHGLFSPRPVVGAEQEDHWRAFLAATAGSLNPTTTFQQELADHAALALWRLKRITRYESATISLQLDRVDAAAAPDTPGGLAALRLRLDQRRHDLDTLQSFPSLDDDAVIPRAGALTLIVAATSQSDHVDPEQLAVPGAAYTGTEGQLPIHRVERWTARLVRDLLTYVAALIREKDGATCDAASLLEAAVASAQSDVSTLEADVARAEDTAARLFRERCVPPPDAIDRIIRYESHLTRQLTTALHELEALQRGRDGEHCTPPTRASLDGSGLDPDFAERNAN
jgi:hypothetical protein